VTPAFIFRMVLIWILLSVSIAISLIDIKHIKNKHFSWHYH
jgi:hypothetical protein